MSIASSIRARWLRPNLFEQGEFYERPRTPDEIRQWQLDRFNELWSGLRRTVPYYQRLCERNTLPISFPTWEIFQELMPTVDRRVAQAAKATMADQTKPPDFWRTTGGSTAEPLQIPIWKSEVEVAAHDLWIGRSWFGVRPSDRLFLIWGHSHLLGTGVRGWLNGWKRRATDRLLGYYRQSAYDLSDKALEQAGEALLRFRPAYVLGYSVALDRFARVNRRRREEFHRLGLRVAIATAESFPRPESREILSDVLGCPTVMEYGTVETGPIAHERPGGGFSVFWRSYFVEGEPSQHVPAACEILVTSLFPRCVPLVRYRVGDLISGGRDFALGFDRVLGRCNDLVPLSEGGVVHSEAFAHVLKDLPEVTGYQVVQDDGESVQLSYVAERLLAPATEVTIRKRLARVHPSLAAMPLVRVENLERTIAGKAIQVARR